MQLLIAAALAAAAMQPQQFDLDCSSPISKPNPVVSQATVHFRFDLAKNKWCEGDCGQVHDILQVQPTVIWLDKSPEDVPVSLMHYRQIDRQTGEYTRANRYGIEAASCVQRPFSGFPTFKTKF